MRSYNILIFPCGTEIANEAINSLRNHKYFKTFFASSEEISYCNFRKKEIFSLPFVTNKDFKNKLNTLINEKNIDFIVPAHDDVAFELSILSSELNCKIIGQSEFTNKIVRFKDKTYEYFKDILPIANIYNSIPKEEDFPVFVKPKKGQGAFNALSLESIDKFNSFFKHHHIDEFIIMEKLTGEEFTIDCFSNNGQVLYSGVRTREKTTRGISVLSTLITDEKLNSEFRNYADQISSKLQLHGIWFFQMKFDKNNNLKLLEIGPRIPGSMMLNRARGINFIELAIYQALNYDVKVIFNDIQISLARALTPKYKHNIIFNDLYIDFDDTLYLDEKKINSELIKLIFDAKNDNKKVYLITKNIKNNLTKTLHNFGIVNIFDDIIHIKKDQSKIDFMNPKSLLIDDSFEERLTAIENGHYAYGIDGINVIY